MNVHAEAHSSMCGKLETTLGILLLSFRVGKWPPEVTQEQ